MSYEWLSLILNINFFEMPLFVSFDIIMQVMFICVPYYRL